MQQIELSQALGIKGLNGVFCWKSAWPQPLRLLKIAQTIA
jgi:hypothetical protein